MRSSNSVFADNLVLILQNLLKGTEFLMKTLTDFDALGFKINKQKDDKNMTKQDQTI